MRRPRGITFLMLLFPMLWGVSFITGIGYFLYLKGIKEIGAAATAKFIFLVPVSVLVLAFLFLGEPVPPFKVLAAALIVAGLWVAKE